MPIVAFSTIFAVLADPQNTSLAGTIQAMYPGNFIQIRPGQWLIAATGTAKDVSDTLMVSPDGGLGPAVILAVSGYYGRANNQIWEWLAANMGKPTNA